MELYLDLRSQPCRSVLLFAKVNGIPFEFKQVELIAGEQKSEAFGKITMIRKVPVMKDGDFILTESVAILKYLAQKYSSKVADHWFPADLQKQARVNEYLAWQHTNLRAFGSKVFLLRAMFPLAMGTEVPKPQMDAAMKELNESLDLLEEKFLQSKPFIVSDKISVADLVAIVEIMQPLGSGLDVFKDRPKLSAWRDRVKKEVGVKLFDETHDQIINLQSIVKQMDSEGKLEALKERFRMAFSQ